MKKTTLSIALTLALLIVITPGFSTEEETPVEKSSTSSYFRCLSNLFTNSEIEDKGSVEEKSRIAKERADAKAKEKARMEAKIRRIYKDNAPLMILLCKLSGTY